MYSKKISLVFTIPIFQTLFMLAVLLVAQPAIALEDRVQELVEGAKKEGKMSFYTSMGQQDCSALLQKFEAKYPFIKTELSRLNAERLLIKFLAEAKAKRNTADVIINGGFRTQITKKAGLLMKYVSPESKAYPEGFKDPEGYWTDTFNNANVLAYNTRLVAAKDLPQNYEDLLQPRWKGKIGMETKAYEWFFQMLRIMGEEKGIEYMKKLAQQKPMLRIGGTLLAQLVVAGEFPLAITTYSNGVEVSRSLGAPVDWIPLYPVIGILHPVAIAAHAPHPHAAKLFVDFVLSKEGMGIIRSFKRIPSRPDVEPDPPRLTHGFRIFPSEPLMADDYEKYVKMFRTIFLQQ